VSTCPGLHCPGCGDRDFGPAAALISAAAIVAVVVAFAEEILVITGTVVVVALATVVFFAVRAYRRGWRPSLNPVVAWDPRAALPPPEATARPTRALPAQEFHLHLHGPLTREQLGEVAAIREAGYRAFGSRSEP
jgi:hypothetical protein